MGSELVLSREFFNRPAYEVAPDLLGCVIECGPRGVRGVAPPGGTVAVRLTEVEAYSGEADPASHAWRGRTARNAVMFGPAGHAYVYFTYGMHFCVNLVCLPEGTASAVLLRAGRVIAGEELARARRAAAPGDRNLAARDLARGPARLCVALGIDRALDGADACDPASPLRIRPALGAGAPVAGGSEAGGTVRSGPRTGVSRAADVQWRFWLDGEPTVSAYRAHVPRRRAPDQPHI